MDITEIENLLLAPLDNMADFAVVDSAGREGEAPDALRYPAASALFHSMTPRDNQSREINDLKFLVFVSTKNLRGEQDAARSAYSLIVMVKAAIHGQTFGRANMEPFEFKGCVLAGYEDGIITYQLTFEVTYYGEITIDQPV